MALGTSLEAVALSTPQALLPSDATADETLEVAVPEVSEAKPPQLELQDAQQTEEKAQQQQAQPEQPGASDETPEPPPPQPHPPPELPLEPEPQRQPASVDAPAPAVAAAAEATPATSSSSGKGLSARPHPSGGELAAPTTKLSKAAKKAARVPPALQVQVHHEPELAERSASEVQMPRPSPKRPANPPSSPPGKREGGQYQRRKKQTTDAHGGRRHDGWGGGAGRWQQQQQPPPPPRLQQPPPPAAPPGPPRCYFEEAQPLQLPAAPALAALDRCLHGFVRRTMQQAQQVDAPALAMMARVQAEVAELWPGASVSCYGSRATGLACATSDVDLVVLGVPGLEGYGGVSSGGGPPSSEMEAQLRALELLRRRLDAISGVTSTSIQKSTVPIIALTASPQDAAAAAAAAAATATATAAGTEAGAGAGASAGGSAGSGSVELHLDISLYTSRHCGLLAAQHVRCLHQALPALQPLVLVLKELLRRHQLKTAYTGGLSSYALTVMAAHFLLDASAPGGRGGRARPPLVTHEPPLPPGAPEPAPTLATLLLSCLHFFGEVFDAKAHAVCAGYGGVDDLALGGFTLRAHRALEAFELHPLLVCDPVSPTNNVAKGCYRIAQIQKVFRQAAAAAIGAVNAAASASAAASTPEEIDALADADADTLEALLTLKC